MRRCVVIGGAEIEKYDVIRSFLRSDDYNIFCDCGLAHMKRLGISPDLIVGDFDSYEKPDISTEILTLPCEKDDTDTVFAVKEAVRRGFCEFLLIGMTGNRIDHTIGNISMLLWLHSADKSASIIDDYSQMEIVDQKTAFVSDKYSYFSLLSIDGKAEKICIKNAKYPLDNAVITGDYQYGISNEVLPGKTAEISVGKGRLLLIKVR